MYHDASRQLQDRFDTRRLADRLAEKLSRTAFTDEDRAFVASQSMFFFATADADGWPECSYKGGVPGFVRVLDAQTLAFPSYDGNGMFRSLGNVVVNPRVGLLFIDFERRRRMRLNGVASVAQDDPLLGEYPEAQLVVRVRATEVFPNCPRYIHRMELVEHSRHTPRANHVPPIPDWKQREWAVGVLKADDPANELHAQGQFLPDPDEPAD